MTSGGDSVEGQRKQVPLGKMKAGTPLRKTATEYDLFHSKYKKCVEQMKTV